jgi:hypothetical protein
MIVSFQIGWARTGEQPATRTAGGKAATCRFVIQTQQNIGMTMPLIDHLLPLQSLNKLYEIDVFCFSGDLTMTQLSERNR